MFVPVGTDAPIYHLPVVTALLAVVNVGVHIALGQVDPAVLGTGLGDLKLEWALWLGEGVHPLQWITSAFLHGGWFHLVANVAFLWGFGIIVEGKLGWWRFLLLYLAVAALSAAALQLVLLPGGLTDQPRAQLEETLRERRGLDDEQIEVLLDDYNGGRGYPQHAVALGADAAIFGLIAISMIWAPRNDLNVFWIIGIRWMGISEMSILTFSLLYLGLETLGFALQFVALGPRFAASNAFLNLLGAAAGTCLGTLLLKKGWVDCENWDLFAVLKGTHGNRDQFELQRSTYQRELTVPTQTASGPGAVKPGEELPESGAAPRSGRPTKGKKKPRRQVDTFARLRKHLEAGDGISALGEWETLIGSRPKLVPPEPDLFALAEAVDKANFTEEAGDLFALYLRSYAKPKPDAPPLPEGEEPPAYDAAHAGVIRLRAARRLLERPGRRGQAATLLRGVDAAALSPKQRQMLEKLAAAAAG